MKLPVVSEPHLPDPASLWRRFSDALFDHALALGEEIAVPFGRAVSTPTGCMYAVLPAGPPSPEVFTGMQRNFDAIDRWITPDFYPAPISASDFGPEAHIFYRLEKATAPRQSSNFAMILPARASAARFGAFWQRQLDPYAQIAGLHLDDPQYEAIVALHRGDIVATAALQTRGETGLICDVAAESEIGQTAKPVVVSRVIELAGRSLLRDVFLGAPATDDWPAAAGFAEVGRFTVWRRRA